MPRGRPKKSPFDMVSPELKDAAASMSVDELNAKVAETAKAESANRDAKKADQQLAEARLAAKMAGAQYSEASKANAQTIKFLAMVLNDRGRE